MKKIIFVLLSIVLLSSCQEENYDLKVSNNDPVLVVDARVLSNLKSIEVNLSQSTDFLGDNPQKFVNDASIFVKINDNDEFQLDFLENGNYLGENVIVEENTKYDLRIVWNDNEYTSSASMFNVVPINYFFIEESSFGGKDGEPLFTFDMILNIDLNYTNYYLTEGEVVASKDEEIVGDDAYLQWDDENYASNPALFPFFVAQYPDSTLVKVKFSHVSKEVYDFYSSLGDVGSQNPSSIAPANPLSNITNGAIGSFGAFAIFDTTIVIF